MKIDSQAIVRYLTELRLGPRASGDEHNPLRWRAEHAIEREFWHALNTEAARIVAQRMAQGTAA